MYYCAFLIVFGLFVYNIFKYFAVGLGLNNGVH